MSDDGNNLTGKAKTNDSRGMRKALSSIAQELQWFYTPAIKISSLREDNSDEIFEKLNMVRSKLLLKDKQMKTLRRKLKTACVVTRSVMSAKEDETAFLSNRIQLTRKQCESLLQKNRLNSKLMEDSQSENQFLKNEMDAIEIFINLGYKELQKMREIPYKNIPVMQKLREIMVCCGQYYSDYCTQQLEIQRLEQSKRYVSHKLNILANSIEATSEELDTMRIQNVRLQAENDSLKRKQNSAKPIMGVQKADFDRSIYLENKEKNKLSFDEPKYRNKPFNLNFSSHLTLIEKLLDDQDDMLKYLKKISDELTIEDLNCF